MSVLPKELNSEPRVRADRDRLSNADSARTQSRVSHTKLIRQRGLSGAAGVLEPVTRIRRSVLLCRSNCSARDIGFSIAAYPGPTRKSSAAALSSFLLFGANADAALMIIGSHEGEIAQRFCIAPSSRDFQGSLTKIWFPKIDRTSSERPQ
jgi:hypothetical protein